MRRYLTALILTPWFAACGGDQTAVDDGGVDAPTDTTSGDGNVVDAATQDAIADSPTDAAADGPSYPPAVWSLALSHATYADGDWAGAKVGLGVQGVVGMVFKNTSPALSDDAGVSLVYDEGDAALIMSSIYTEATVVSVNDVDDINKAGQQIALSAQPGTSETKLVVNDMTTSQPFISVWSDLADNPIPRFHQDPVSQVMAFDSVPSGTFSYAAESLAPGGLLIYNRAISGARLFPAGSSNGFAVDCVRGYASTYYIMGRMDGPSFDFGADSGATSGSGYFIAQYVPTFTTVQWVRVFGGTPLFAASIGGEAPESASIRGAFDSPFTSGTDLTFTVPFTGTIDFGNGKQFSAPQSGQATALAVIDATGNVTFAKAFNKGPSSANKTSRPSAYRVLDSNLQPVGFRLFDTVWDTIDLGGTTVTATAGADVVIADFDLNGNLTSYRMYGGPGDDEAYRIFIEGSGGDYAILGHSMQTINFGNGALATTASEGEVWVARMSP